MARFNKAAKVTKPKSTNKNKSLKKISQPVNESDDEELPNKDDLLKSAMSIIQSRMQLEAGTLEKAIAKGGDVDSTVAGLLDGMLEGVMSGVVDKHEKGKKQKLEEADDDEDDEWETTDGSDEDEDEEVKSGNEEEDKGVDEAANESDNESSNDSKK